MAFVRVAGDLNVRFTKVYKQPYVERDVEVATGSGFVIAPSGLVLTNLHVVSDEPFTRVIDGYEAEITLESRRIEVAIGPGGSVAVLDGAVVASDAELDLAVLQVTAADLPYLPFGDSDAVEPGRPVQVLGFPFGRKVEVGKQADAGVVPRVSVTAGSLSAAREDDEGGRRYLQTDASVQPGNSGGPMLDDEGYAVGVVRMKLAREATARGAGFGIPINLVKDFLDAHGLLALLPVSRLRPGVVHSFDWKGLRVEMPDGFQDGSPSRLRVATGEAGDGISFRVDRVATPWDRRDARGGAPRGEGAARVRPGAGGARASARPGPAGASGGLGHGHAAGRRAVPRGVRAPGPAGRERGGALPGAARRPGLQPGPAAALAGDARGRPAADGRGEPAALSGSRGDGVPWSRGRAGGDAFGLEPRAGVVLRVRARAAG